VVVDCQEIFLFSMSRSVPEVFVVSRKSPLGCKYIRGNDSVVCGPKYTNFFSSNVGVVGDFQELFRFSMSRSVPEIFVIKVESCQKSH